MDTRLGQSQGGETGADRSRGTRDDEPNHTSDDPSPIIRSITPLLEVLSEAVVAFDLDGSCIYANPACERLVERPSDELTGPDSPPWWIHPRHTDFWTFLFDWCRSPRSFPSEVLSSDLDLDSGGTPWLRARITWDPVLGHDLAPVGLLGLIRAAAPEPATTATVGKDQELTVILDDLRQILGRMGSDPGSGSSGLHPIGGIENAGPAGRAAGEEWRERLGGLSAREAEVLSHLLEGKRIATTAHLLYLSEHTVRNHLKAIYRKLGVHSLAEMRELLTPSGRTVLMTTAPQASHRTARGGRVMTVDAG